MKIPEMNMNQARFIAGGGVFVLTLIILGIMIWYPEMAKDDLFKMIAQAIVIQGLIGLVMAFLFTGKNGGDTPTGIQDVSVKNTAIDPVPTTDEHKDD